MPEDDEDFANERTAIAAKIAETKAGMTENKTGARIDAAGGRLTRAQQRAKEASEALEMAPRVVEESDVEIACIECELHDLEAALAHVPAVSAAIGVDNTVDSVSGQLQRLQAILKENSRVDLQPDAPSCSSLCTAHRRVSTCLRGSGAATWSQSGLLQRDCSGNKPRKSIHCEREELLQQHQSEHDDRSDGQCADAAPERSKRKQIDVWRNTDEWENRISRNCITRRCKRRRRVARVKVSTGWNFPRPLVSQILRARPTATATQAASCLQWTTFPRDSW